MGVEPSNVLTQNVSVEVGTNAVGLTLGRNHHEHHLTVAQDNDTAANTWQHRNDWLMGCYGNSSPGQ